MAVLNGEGQSDNLMGMTEAVLQDLRYGARMLVRNAGSTVVTVLALSLGIGVNTAVFTAYKAIVLRPLDARAPGEMVNLALKRASGASEYAFSYPDYEAYRDSLHSFSGLVAFRPTRVVLSNIGGAVGRRTPATGPAFGKLSGSGNAEFASTFVVSENYFKVMGVKAVQGRTFDAMSSAELAAVPSVLISENYWERRLGKDPAILGKTIYLNGAAVTIIGVTPHDFAGTSVGAPAFWLPVNLEPLIHGDDKWLRDRENQNYRLFGRLAYGAGIGQAQAEMNLAADRLRALHNPPSDAAKPAVALVWPGSPFPLPLKHYGGLRLAIFLIMGAAGVVLTVACANVGSLQVARVRSRETELRTRMSLGASRLRVVRQLVTESALVGVLAGVLALLVTWTILKVSVTLIVNALPIEYATLVFNVTPDARVFAYVSAISLIAGMLSGLAPALESARSALSSAVRGGTSTTRSRRLQDILVAAQVALSLVLMIAGSMLIRSSINSLKMDTGYEAKRVVKLELQFPETSKYSAARLSALLQEMRPRLAGIPGVTEMTSGLPPGAFGLKTAVEFNRAKTEPGPNVRSILHYAYVQANYFQTLGVPVVLGRAFTDERGRPEYSVMLSESAARTLWPEQSPIGQRLRLGPVDERFHDQSELAVSGPVYQVIGVVRDTRGVEFDASDSKRIYLPMPTDRLQNYPILIRTQSDPEPVIKAIEAVIVSIDPNLMATISTLEEALHQSPPFVVSSIAAALASAVGLFGLLLASMGIYGTVSYIVVLRTREVGIRMAIGAQKRDVLALILQETARPVVTGLLAGMMLATVASYAARGLLYGLNGIDVISFAGVGILFLTIALLASLAPARRAMGVDPMVALRHE